MPSVLEPWLRGPVDGVHPVIGAVVHAYRQAREDLAEWTEGFSEEQIWARPQGVTPIGYHLRHIAGSVDRLTTYLKGRRLDALQIDALNFETDEGAGRDELLRMVDAALDASEAFLRTVDPATFGEPRAVGRKQIATTVGGLVVHLAEHTQRHVGQTVVTARLLRQG